MNRGPTRKPFVPRGGRGQHRGGHADNGGTPAQQQGQNAAKGGTPHGGRGVPQHGNRGVPQHGNRGVPQHGNREVPQHGNRGVPPHGGRGVPQHGNGGIPQHGSRGVPPHGNGGVHASRRGFRKRGFARGFRHFPRNSAGQSLIEFKRGLCGEKGDRSDTLSRPSSRADDWPDEESVESEGLPEPREPSPTLPPEPERFEDLMDEVPAVQKVRMKMGFVSVFWDIQNCAVPSGVSAYAIVKKVRDHFYGGLREADFVVACDILAMKAKVTEELNDAHVTVIHVSSERKNSADEKLRVRLRRFADQHRLSGSTIVLLSGDVDFAAELHEMRYHDLIRVVLVHNDQARKELVDVANQSRLYSSFVEDLKPKGGGGPAKSPGEGSSKGVAPVKENRPPCSRAASDSGNLPPANKVTTVGVRVSKELGNLVFWKGYLTGVLPAEFVLKVHLSDVLHVTYPNADDAGRACKKLTKLRAKDADAPVCLGIVVGDEEKRAQVTEEERTQATEEKLRTSCVRKVQEATNLQHGRIGTCGELLDKVKGQKGQLVEALKTQLCIYEAQLREFLVSVNTPKRTSEGGKQKINTEAKRLRAALAIYAVKSELLEKATRSRLTLLSAFPGSGKSLQLVSYLLEVGNPRILVVEPTPLAAERCATYAKSVAALAGVECRIGPTAGTRSESSVVFTTPRCFFYEYLRCSGGLGEFEYVVVDEIPEDCPYQKVVLQLLREQFCGHAKIVVCTNAGKSENRAITSPDLVRIGCGVAFPVSVVWNPPQKDVVSQTVRTVLDVLKAEDDEGNVVAFVASASDAFLADASLARELANVPRLEGKVFHEVLYEGAGLWQEELPPGARRVVFATEVSDFDVTVLCPRHVVDCGLRERFVYAGGVLKKRTTFVSEAEAEARGAAAGTAPGGTCTRLYDRDAFEKRAEEGVVSPSRFAEDVVLRLIARDVNVARRFPEAISEDEIDGVRNHLERLGATKDGVPTELARKLCLTSLEPRLGKFVLEAARSVSVPDAVVLALLAYEDLRCAFCPLDSDGKPRKVAFEGGNAFAEVLRVYHEWLDVPKKGKSCWCKLNGINESFLKRLHRAATRHRQEFEALKLESKASDSSLGAAFLASFPEGFCVAGPAGYAAQMFGSKLKVSPLSPVAREGALPGRLVCTLFTVPPNAKKPQLLNFVPVDDDVSRTAGTSERPLEFGPVGNLIWNHEFSQEQSLSALRAALEEGTGLKSVELSADAERRRIVVDVPERLHGFVAAFLRSVVVQQVSNLTKKDLEVCASSPGSSFVDDGFRVVLDGGGNASEVLSPTDFRTVRATDVKMPVNAFCKWVNELGCIVQYWAVKKERAFLITYKTAAEGERAYREMCEREADLAVQVVPGVVLDNRERANRRCPVLRASARTKRRLCTGVGFATVDDAASLDRIAYSLPCTFLFKGATVTCQRNKNNKSQLYLSGVPPTADFEELRTFLAAMFPVEITSVRLIREPPFETTAEEGDAVRVRLLKLLRSQGNVPDMKWKGSKPGDSHFHATFCPDDVLEGHTTCELARGSLLKTARVPDGIPVELHAEFTTTFALPRQFFVTIADEFRAVLRENQEGHHPRDEMKLDVRAEADGRPLVHVYLWSNNINDFRRTVLAINRILRPTRLEGGGLDAEGLVRCSGILGPQESVYVDRKASGVYLFGKADRVADTRRKVEEYVSDAVKRQRRVLELVMKDASLVKSFVATYGYTPSRFAAELQLVGAEADPSGAKVVVVGSASAMDRADESLRHLQRRPLAANDAESCPVCREAPEANHHRLESCGHPYCLPCLVWVVHVAPLPLSCVSEDCNKEWVAMDLRRAFQGSREVAAFLARRALEVRVRQEPANWKCCPVPGCEYVGKEIGRPGKEAVCPLCHNSVCFRCNSLFHYGTSCGMYRALVAPEGFSEKKWVSQDAARRRVCSACGAATERLGKRRLAACWRCRRLGCWNCGRGFADAGEARAHVAC